MIAILGFIGILVLGFIILGLIGWGVQALGFFASFLGEGITGCIGCFCKFIWFFIVAFVLICLILKINIHDKKLSIL